MYERRRECMKECVFNELGEKMIISFYVSKGLLPFYHFIILSCYHFCYGTLLTTPYLNNISSKNKAAPMSKKIGNSSVLRVSTLT